eukprot:SAG31_NODE_507_length_14746_cov_5.682119_8_plen_196_part_00
MIKQWGTDRPAGGDDHGTAPPRVDAAPRTPPISPCSSRRIESVTARYALSAATVHALSGCADPAAMVWRQIKMGATFAAVAMVMGSAAGLAAEPSQSIPYFSGTYYVVEAENFTTTEPAAAAGGWSPKVWAKDPNYFASVCYNTFMSRRAYLHGPASSMSGNATATIGIAGCVQCYFLVFVGLFSFHGTDREIRD